MRFDHAPLEDWMRDYYHSAELDLGSSGVACWSLAELRAMLGITHDELDSIVFHDSTSYGGAELRAAISQRWGDGDPSHVMVTHGSSEAIFLTMTTLLEPGDEVITLDPIYHSLASIAETIGCTLKRWPLDPARGFAPDVADLLPLISPRTRMVTLNFPHNPTGATLTPDQLREVVEATAQVGAYLVWDGALADLTYDGAPLPDPTRSYERCISIGTFSKAHGLPGLRFGWCLAAPDVLARFLPLRDRTTLHLSPLIEFLALRVVRQVDQLIDIRLRQARHNLALLSDWIAVMGDRVEWIRPRPLGGVTIFPRLRARDGVEALCHELIDQHNILLVPGACFGAPDRVRLGFGGPTADFEAGLEQLAQLLERS